MHLAIFRAVEDTTYMRRAMELATLGLGHVSPNPLVGCVVVHDDRIIGEGWHRNFGGPHAEVHAINQVVDSSLLPFSTVYVNLEPCAHFGKTPPCADMLVAKRVRRVVIANHDPNPKVAGKGIDRLRAAGIEVEVGVLAEAGRWLNRRFFTNMEHHRPHVILKWAESADGYMASSRREPLWISTVYSRQRVHQWRAEEDAVLVGAGTAEIDNPQLTVRDWSGRNPVRVVIDPTLRLPHELRLFDRSQRTLVVNCLRSGAESNLEFIQVSEENLLSELLAELLRRNIGSLLVEGGPYTLKKFVELNLWHEARVFRSRNSLKEGIAAPRLNAQPITSDQATGDEQLTYLNRQEVKA